MRGGGGNVVLGVALCTGTSEMTAGGLSGLLMVAVVVPLAAVLIKGMLIVLVGGILMMEGVGVLMAEGLWTLMVGAAGF